MATHRIFVVEDEEMIRDSLVEFLDEHGYEAVGAAHGRDALDKLAASDLLPCLILLDLMMPGMDGSTFLQIGQKAQHRLQAGVIIVTALSASEAADRTAGLDVVATLEKKEGFYGRVMDLVRQQLGSAAHH